MPLISVYIVITIASRVVASGVMVSEQQLTVDTSRHSYCMSSQIDMLVPVLNLPMAVLPSSPPKASPQRAYWSQRYQE